MRVGAVGLGSRTATVFNELLKINSDITMISYVDPYPIGRKIAEENNFFPNQKYETLHEMLKNENLDLLMVGSPNHLHLEHITEGLEAGLKIFEVQKLESHGGSLRILGSMKNSFHKQNPSVEIMLDEEKRFGISNLTTYENFQEKANNIKNNLIKLLVDLKSKNKKVMAYGAAAKGNTLLNYCGIKSDLLKFIADKAESKQNLYMPGSHIPIKHPKYLDYEKINYLLVLPWNLIKEIKNENKNKILVTAIPKLIFT